MVAGSPAGVRGPRGRRPRGRGPLGEPEPPKEPKAPPASEGPPDAALPSEAAVPRFPRGVRLRYDERREEWVLLGPERVLKLDGAAAEIAKLVDGARSVEAIVDDLSARFEADRERISGDVRAFLGQLAARRLLEL